MADSCWCMTETNTILKSNYLPIKNFENVMFNFWMRWKTHGISQGYTSIILLGQFPTSGHLGSFQSLVMINIAMGLLIWQKWGCCWSNNMLRLWLDLWNHISTAVTAISSSLNNSDSLSEPFQLCPLSSVSIVCSLGKMHLGRPSA